MNTLIEKLEALEAPCTKCDQAIGIFIRNLALADGMPKIIGVANCPQYTASIEKAMKLLDPRAMWAIGNMEEGPFARLCWPNPNGGFGGGYFEGFAFNALTAICIAVLRALEQSNG